MLKTRLLTAFVLLAVFFVILYLLPSWAWSVALALVVWSGAGEWARLAGLSASLAWIYRAGVLLGGLVLLPEFNANASAPLFLLSLALWVLLVPWWLAGARHVKSHFILGMTGWLLLVPTWIALIELREAGQGLVLATLGLVWISDSSAYFAGRAFGKHKLAPSISPGKTWEGVVGALLAVSIYMAILMQTGAFGVAEHIKQGWIVALPLAWGLTALGIVGDLFESWIKRCAGVKDSGTLLPGHGGVLDRIDALTAVMPLAALALLLS